MGKDWEKITSFIFEAGLETGATFKHQFARKK